jgi:hypothetical protein
MKNMNNRRWYTTAKTVRLISGLLIALGVNIIYQEIRWERIGKLVYTVILIIGHANISGLAVYYIVYGVTKRPGIDRVIVKTITLSLFIGVLLSGGNKALLQILSGAYAAFIVYLTAMIAAKRNTGDNIIRDGKSVYIDGSYFDYINDAVYLMNVSFPLDIENYRHDRKEGSIKEIGMIEGGKYKGKPGAVVKSGEKLYLCPLERISITEYIHDEILAGRGDETVVKAVKDKDKSDIIVIGRLECVGSV